MLATVHLRLILRSAVGRVSKDGAAMVRDARVARSSP